jgi:hypothetical protein
MAAHHRFAAAAVTYLAAAFTGVDAVLSFDKTIDRVAAITRREP